MNDNKTTIKELKSLVHEFNMERDWDQFHNAKIRKLMNFSKAKKRDNRRRSSRCSLGSFDAS